MASATPTPNDNPEAEVQEDLMRLDAYRNQLNAMLQQFQILSASRTEHARARESLEGIDRADPATEMLLPLGGEAYVRGAIARDVPVLIGMGSGVVVEMERAKVTELLAERLVRIDQALRETEGQMAALDERIQILSRRLDDLARAASTGPDVGRV
ncbi:MAG TPA: prefoldin subunit alpha [Thermoplasmata archaeon]|nr:prefoldin subunit alpha [Thermoplasmata archaeon]